MRHVITLPNGRQCSVGVYAKAWKVLLGWLDRDSTVSYSERRRFPGFSHEPETAESIVHAMRGGMSERINRHITGYGKGRKWSLDWYYSAWRDSRRLRDIAKRIRVYQFETYEARSRFSHLLTSMDGA
jgi:hypothetical protein